MKTSTRESDIILTRVRQAGSLGGSKIRGSVLLQDLVVACGGASKPSPGVTSPPGGEVSSENAFAITSIASSF